MSTLNVMEKRRYWIYALLIIVPFLTALFLPALNESLQGETWHEAYGWEALCYGWLTPPWYANIFLVIGSYMLLVHKDIRKALTYGTVAFALAVIGVPLTYMMIFEPATGYYVWTFSCLTLLTASRIENARQISISTLNTSSVESSIFKRRI